MAVLVLTAASAAVAAFAERSSLPAAATTVVATAAAVLVRRGRGLAQIAAVVATVVTAGFWTAVEARSRHVLIPWLAGLAVFAALLLLRQRTDDRDAPARSIDSLPSDGVT